MGKQKTCKKIVKHDSKSAKKTKTEPKKLGNVFDTFVKQMFGQILVFIDFLLFYADLDFIDAIDLTKIRLLRPTTSVKMGLNAS